MKKSSNWMLILFVGITIGLTLISKKTEAQENAEVIGKKLANPVANLISVPVQNNIDYGIGANNGSKYTINVQPVIPIKLSAKLKLVTRYILPIIFQRDITGEATGLNGLGDLTISAYISPVSEKITWGFGPVILIPTATNDLLGTKKWGLGPSALILKQSHGITYGLLANQTWSVAGDEQRGDVSVLFVQPFLAYNWKSGAGVSVNSEITQNWEAESTIAFLNFAVSGVTKLGGQMISLSIGPRIPIASPAEARPDFGFRASITFVFPK
jgi:hypothetical protein